MALYYRTADIKGGRKAMTLARVKAFVSRELKISPVYVSFDAEGEYIRVEFAKPRPRKRARPAGRRKPKKSNSLKIIGIEFKPR